MQYEHVQAKVARYRIREKETGHNLSSPLGLVAHLMPCPLLFTLFLRQRKSSQGDKSNLAFVTSVFTFWDRLWSEREGMEAPGVPLGSEKLGHFWAWPGKAEWEVRVGRNACGGLRTETGFSHSL